MVAELVTDVPSTISSVSATIDALSSSTTDPAITILNSAATDYYATLLSASSSSNVLLSFSDQGQNLAGIFFQASLLPYLSFLYFLSFRGNRTPNLGNFGFQYLLLFVLGTIPSGIITKSVYGESLANVDRLHGGAEALLTITNVLIVLGFREAMTNPNYTATDGSKFGNVPKIVGGVAVGMFAAACAFGTKLGFEAHSPFLFGIGNLSQETVSSLPFGTCVVYNIIETLCFFVLLWIVENDTYLFAHICNLSVFIHLMKPKNY